MPTIAWNRTHWDAGTYWADRGEGWSRPWGTPEMQWYGSILPRVQRHLPAGMVLEIACGYGRWTNFLRQHCDRLIGVDLVGQCVQACRKRFDGDRRLSFVQNDGRSLSLSKTDLLILSSALIAWFTWTHPLFTATFLSSPAFFALAAQPFSIIQTSLPTRCRLAFSIRRKLGVSLARCVSRKGSTTIATPA